MANDLRKYVNILNENTQPITEVVARLEDSIAYQFAKKLRLKRKKDSSGRIYWPVSYDDWNKGTSGGIDNWQEEIKAFGFVKVKTSQPGHSEAWSHKYETSDGSYIMSQGSRGQGGDWTHLFPPEAVGTTTPPPPRRNKTTRAMIALGYTELAHAEHSNLNPGDRIYRWSPGAVDAVEFEFLGFGKHPEWGNQTYMLRNLDTNRRVTIDQGAQLFIK